MLKTESGWLPRRSKFADYAPWHSFVCPWLSVLNSETAYPVFSNATVQRRETTVYPNFLISPVISSVGKKERGGKESIGWFVRSRFCATVNWKGRNGISGDDNRICRERWFLLGKRWIFPPVVILFFSRTPASSFDFQRCTTAFSVYSLYILARTWKIERVNASLMRVSNIFSENFSAQTEGNIFEWEVG